MKAIAPFHLAFPIKDIESTRKFYHEVLGCTIGRSTEKWIDFDFFGHQLSAHVNTSEPQQTATSVVDGKQVPLRHFGAVLEWEDWHNLAERLKANKTEFLLAPSLRFQGEAGEQATMFFLDPSGNALEFKSFKDQSQLFAK
ncbi:glyoxalase/bleomycin resistance protein/dioxygenase superfamily protein [Echinicola pacifica]|uniref:Glyoxalase/bleomycin resistance protein/dioxygenase superfamily protein n=1 Tax=Echinicola pacifica TaxID=346377 RepID=A0A918PRE8_9BACT|nr:VOC family protein [Echinicola pacifica]GGZ19327.1 glyoxalase/bleomycin resistance protein/dioxygenase superfamily protein [Echinicola pacifica]